ncbi:hypothetical protein ABMC88_16620 [Sulfitobacter sp. HNIBRBA2951]|uniref:hypothetical protein n=1 Tax=Sulfitobacter aquimarinus TaxID=3158557 RepID=UPI0032DE793F
MTVTECDIVTDWDGTEDTVSFFRSSAIESHADWTANTAQIGADKALSTSANTITFCKNCAGFAVTDFVV